MLREDRGESDPAVAGDHRGDAVPRRRLEPVVPDGLTVVMGVHVDEAWCHDGAIGVDFALPPAADRPDGDDLASADRDVGVLGVIARSVDHGARADNEIEVVHVSLQPASR